MSLHSENVIKSLSKSVSNESLGLNELEEKFKARIRTFVDGQKWVRRPLVLSPDICSRYGWKCVKSDLLQCVTCSAKLCTHEPNMENIQAYEECVQKILTDLKDCHRKYCPWPLTPCPGCRAYPDCKKKSLEEVFVSMTTMSREDALNQFLHRVKSCLIFKDFLPEIAKTATSDLEISDDQIHSLCKVAEMNSEEKKNYGKAAVLLASTGWSIKKKESSSLKAFLTCESCQRSAWCGSFVSLKNSLVESDKDSESDKISTLSKASCDYSLTENSSDEPIVKRKRLSSPFRSEPFNPFYEHRIWCLWICTNVEKNILNKNSKLEEVSCLPGFKIFLKSLLRNLNSPEEAKEVCSPSKEQIRSVKDLLETWPDVQKD